MIRTRYRIAAARRPAVPAAATPLGNGGAAVIPRPWAVERTFARLTAHHRLARNYERDPAASEAMIRCAAINTITHRIARGGPTPRQQRPLPPQSVNLREHVLTCLWRLSDRRRTTTDLVAERRDDSDAVRAMCGL
jgi:hypothetical protein